MHKIRWFSFGALLGLFSAAAAPQDLAPGQVWTFRDAASETTRLAIGKIEPYGDGEVVQLQLYGIPELSGPDYGSVSGSIGHAPFDRSVIEASVLTLEAIDWAPDTAFWEGYQTWAENEGGIWTIPPAEVVQTVLDMVAEFRRVDRHSN